MIVYADILIAVNLIVDYFLLRVTLSLLRVQPPTYRLLLSALLGGVFSLYIFLPDFGFFADIATRILMSASMMLVCLGFGNLKFFLRANAVFFTVSCSYGGIMISLWQLLKPKGMIINNSVVYFNISPVVLALFTALGYFLYLVFSRLFTISAKAASRCQITLYYGDKRVSATAIIDTGNSLRDILSDSEIIIGDKSLLISLFGTLQHTEGELTKRFRAIPCTTVSGTGFLKGFRCDKGEIFFEKEKIFLKNPILAASEKPMKEDFSAILNPKILDLRGKTNENKKLTV